MHTHNQRLNNYTGHTHTCQIHSETCWLVTHLLKFDIQSTAYQITIRNYYQVQVVYIYFHYYYTLCKLPCIWSHVLHVCAHARFRMQRENKAYNQTCVLNWKHCKYIVTQLYYLTHLPFIHSSFITTILHPILRENYITITGNENDLHTNVKFSTDMQHSKWRAQ